jgi:hypothetical protein
MFKRLALFVAILLEGISMIGGGSSFALAHVDTACVRRYNGPENSDDKALTMMVDDSGCVDVTGSSYGIGTGYDYATIKYSESSSSVEDETQVWEKPSEFNLSQNYPNPLNLTTTIRFTVYRPQSTVSRSLPTTVKIHDVLREDVRSLLDDKKLPCEYTVQWDGRNDQGEQLSSGVYFYQLKVGTQISAKKMVLLK